MNPGVIKNRISQGESATLESKSAGQLDRAGETLCAFLNGEGGSVVIGVTADGKLVGQEISDKTRREIAAMLDRFEPPAPVDVQFVNLPKTDRTLIVLEAKSQGEALSFRPYERVETTTSVMTRERFETLLLERAHARRRLENQPAVDVRLKDLDHEEILRTREAAIQKVRISAGTSSRTGVVEVWGRGTNRAIEECKRYGVEPPNFEEQAGGLIVTFRASIGPEGPVGTKFKCWKRHETRRRSPTSSAAAADPIAPSSGTKSSGRFLRQACWR